MSTKHTAGPWKHQAGTGIITDTKGVRVALTVRDVSTCTTMEEMENADLIASAPDLLKERDELKERAIQWENSYHNLAALGLTNEVEFVANRLAGFTQDHEMSEELNACIIGEVDALNTIITKAVKNADDSKIKTLQSLNAELLEALKWTMHFSNSYGPYPEQKEKIEDIKKMITKAEGRN